jgi:transposase
VGKVLTKIEEKQLVGPPRSGGERSEPERSGGPTSLAAAPGIPAIEHPPIANPEVSPRPIRRRFSAGYKRRILREADTCDPGGIAALLRREGLYSSHLTTWRHQREQGELAGLQPHKRGRKAVPRNPLTAENERLRRANERLQKRLRQAETIIDVQKKLCEMLGLPVATTDSSESDE